MMSIWRSSILAWSCVWLLCAACSQAAPAPSAAPAPAVEAKPATPAPAAVAAEAKPAPAPAPAAQEPQPSAAASPAPGPAAKLVASSACAGICVHSTELHCKRAAECEGICDQSMTGKLCKPQLDAATSCMLKQPATSWECTEAGLAAIKHGVCDAEQKAFVDCMAAAIPR